jgi:uncharacterized repeat protein (TIGR01451 family)
MHATNSERRSVRGLGWLVLACLASPLSVADPARPATLDVKATAAVRQDHPRGRGLVPADRVVPGDEVFYTLEIRNTGSTPLPPPTVDFAIPEHMRYIANSAVGAGADVSYSVDGGHTFDRPENLIVVAGGGDPRLATAADYTHIRWHLKHALQAKAMALARFRAVVK